MAINKRRRKRYLGLFEAGRSCRNRNERDNLWRHLQQRHFVRTTTLLPQERSSISPRPEPIIHTQRQPLQLLYLRSRSHRHRRQRPQQNNIHRKQPTPPNRPTTPFQNGNYPLTRTTLSKIKPIQFTRTKKSRGNPSQDKRNHGGIHPKS